MRRAPVGGHTDADTRGHMPHERTPHWRMLPLQAHCHRGLGRLYATTGQPEQARVELAAAIALYRAMEMTFWLPETEAALSQVKER